MVGRARSRRRTMVLIAVQRIKASETAELGLGQLQLSDLPAQPDALVGAQIAGLVTGTFLTQLADPVAQRLVEHERWRPCLPPAGTQVSVPGWPPTAGGTVGGHRRSSAPGAVIRDAGCLIVRGAAHIRGSGIGRDNHQLRPFVAAV